MSILIEGIDIPTRGNPITVSIYPDGTAEWEAQNKRGIAIPLPPHGRLIDADALRQTMYREAFETDSPMQKWDSGCWIRYKMFERAEESAPTIIPANMEVN